MPDNPLAYAPMMGEIIERQTFLGPRRFMRTSILKPMPDEVIAVLTPIPDGMDDLDLGRKFVASLVETVAKRD